VFQNAGI